MIMKMTDGDDGFETPDDLPIDFDWFQFDVQEPASQNRWRLDESHSANAGSHATNRDAAITANQNTN